MPKDVLDLNQEETSPEILEDPQLQNLSGTEEASDDEERQLALAMDKAMEWMYSEDGMAAIANMFQQDSRELWETIPEVGTMVLEKVHTDMPPDTDGSVWFGQGGMLQQMPSLLFEIAEQLQVPGYDDPDQLAAATIGLYKKVGEYLIERGDKEAAQQAMALGQETLLTGEDGEMMTPEQVAKKGGGSPEPQMNPMASSIQGILGV